MSGLVIPYILNLAEGADGVRPGVGRRHNRSDVCDVGEKLGEVESDGRTSAGCRNCRGLVADNTWQSLLLFVVNVNDVILIATVYVTLSVAMGRINPLSTQRAGNESHY